MAAGFARRLSGKDIEVSSGGSQPADEVNENAVKVMKESGIDISSQKPTKISSEDVDNADFVITMGCGSNACPVPAAGNTLEWEIEDPSGQSIEKFREARDEIEEGVRALLKRVSQGKN